MIITLEGADFSQNNIGKISTGLSADTKKVLSKLTKYSQADDEAFALDNYITKLKSYGVWSKLNKLYIPALANNLSQVFYDVKGHGDGYDFLPSEDNLSFADGGVAQLTTKQADISLSTPLDVNNFSCGAYVIDGRGEQKVDNAHLFKFGGANFGCGVVASDTYYQMRLSLPDGSGSVIPTSSQALSNNTTSSIKFWLTNREQSMSTAYTGYIDQTRVQGKTTSPVTSPTGSVNAVAIGTGKIAMPSYPRAKNSLMFISAYLTDEESVNLRDATYEFMSALGIN